MKAIKGAATLALRCAPVALWRRLVPKTAVGVCYHLVSDGDPPHVRHYSPLDTKAFEADLAHLRREFGFISYSELSRRRSVQDGVRDNAAILTFDDGFAECASIVAPILRRHGVSCVFFIITDLIDNAAVFRETEASLCIEAISRLPVERVEAIVSDLGLGARLQAPPKRSTSDIVRTPLENAGLEGHADPRLRAVLHWLLTVDAREAGPLRRLSNLLGIDPEAYVRRAQPYLTTQQIRQLQSDGFTIGAHSRTHRRLQDLSPEEAEREIVESCRIIRDLTGQASVPFAFPYFGGDIDRAWLARLRQEHGFIGLFFDTNGLREDEPFVVQRVFGERIGGDRTLDGILRRAWSRPSTWLQRGSPPAPNDIQAASSDRPRHPSSKPGFASRSQVISAPTLDN